MFLETLIPGINQTTEPAGSLSLQPCRESGGEGGLPNERRPPESLLIEQNPRIAKAEFYALRLRTISDAVKSRSVTYRMRVGNPDCGSGADRCSQDLPLRLGQTCVGAVNRRQRLACSGRHIKAEQSAAPGRMAEHRQWR